MAASFDLLRTISTRKELASMAAQASNPLIAFLRSPAHTLLDIARSSRGHFRGVFNTFDDAQAAIAKNRLVGYNHPTTTNMYVNQMSKARISDYPAMFWLGRLLAGSSATVFDYGGNVGVSYYKFANYIEYPVHMRWCIYDLPVITSAGATLALERNVPLEFTTDFADADGMDVFFASGAVQYMPEPVSRRLEALRNRPKHILINRIPLSDREPFVTLEDVGPAVCPYHIYNREEFVSGICNLGYKLVDSWLTLDLNCIVRWHPIRSVLWHSGLYFRADHE